MRYIKLLLIVILGQNLMANEITDSMWQKLKDGHVLAYSVVETSEAMGPPAQSLDFKIFGLHPKKCSQALKKISRYEQYKDFIDFVKESRYEEESQMIFFEFSSVLLPYDMLLSFQLPRIEKPGKYEFRFTKGFLNGLIGTVEVEEKDQKCFFTGRANWQGPDTKIPDSVFELFSKNLGKAAMERIFRFSTSL